MWPQEAPLYHTGGQVCDQLADMFDVGQTNGVAGQEGAVGIAVSPPRLRTRPESRWAEAVSGS